MPIPDFREDGYLPEGLHQATEAEVLFRFGASNRRRRQAIRLRALLELARLDESDWLAWVSFFSRTREVDGRRKGLVEVLL